MKPLWTEREKKVLKELVHLYNENRVTKEQICKAMGRSWSAIRSSMQKLGLRFSRDCLNLEELKKIGIDIRKFEIKESIKKDEKKKPKSRASH